MGKCECETESKLDIVICGLMVLLIMSFYLFELKSWGRYVLVIITLTTIEYFTPLFILSYCLAP